MKRRRTQSPAEPADRSKRDAVGTAERLLSPIRSDGLRWFRRVLAAALVYDAVQTARRGEMEDFFAAGRLNFVYEIAPWVRPLSAPAMARLPFAIGASAIVAEFGAPRCGWLACTVAQAYLFMCEAARYVNHFYFYLLLSALFAVTTLDTPRGADCRRWHLLLVRLQLSCVLFFGGLTKCSHEFLVRGEPLRTYLRAAARSRALGSLSGALESEALVAPAAIFATVIDLGASYSLWHPRLLVGTAVASLAFHGLNHLLFPTIGSFPFVSLAATALFLPPTDVRDRAPVRVGPSGGPSASRRATVAAAFCAVWVGAQTLLPLRHHLLSDDVAFTKLGNEFAWRMMGDTTDGWLAVTVELAGRPGRTLTPTSVAPPGEVTLPEHSIPLLLASPTMLSQFAAAVAARECERAGLAASPALAERGGACAPRVTVDAWKGVNGRPFQRWVDPAHDFGGRAPLAPPQWMLPRVRLDAADEARVEAAVAEWRGRGFAVEAFVEGGGHPAWRDQIVHSAGHRKALLVALVGDTGLSFSAPAQHEQRGGDAPQQLLLSAGDVRPLRIGGAHYLWNRGAVPCAWLYAMR